IFWVQKDLLREENLPRRAEVLSHFVRIAKKLVEINNYSSAMAIVSGLLVQSVYRLSATWAALSSRDRSSFRKLADLFSQDQNFINLRTAVDTARLPCIPYLGKFHFHF
ncbi:Ras-specific guanine nucleotide-releasing factor RalGPS2, partial [Fasciolopsis buskii]